MGFGSFGAWCAAEASRAMCANALSQRGGDVFALIGSKPSRAMIRMARGSAITPAKNPSRNLLMVAPAARNSGSATVFQSYRRQLKSARLRHPRSLWTADCAHVFGGLILLQ